MIKRLTHEQYQEFKEKYKDRLKRSIPNPAVEIHLVGEKDYEKIEIGGEIFELSKGEVLRVGSPLTEAEILPEEDFDKKNVRL